MSPTSGSPGSGAGLGRRALKELAARHEIRPAKKLGQHFLADPNLARRIAEIADVGAGDRVLEVGAGLGSLTIALASAGAEVLAIELDRALVPALSEVVAEFPAVRIETGDATAMDWPALLGPGAWTMASNLPYNVAVPVTMDLLESAPGIGRFVLMVQREVGERLVARPGEEAYGAVSVRVAYRGEAAILRRVPPSVFWPPPKVESVLVLLERHARPPVAAAPGPLFRIVREGFAERRKTMRNALRRLGLDATAAGEVLASCGLDAGVRAEVLGLEDFDRLAAALEDAGVMENGDG